jgi:hypothetical protein
MLRRQTKSNHYVCCPAGLIALFRKGDCSNITDMTSEKGNHSPKMHCGEHCPILVYSYLIMQQSF